MKKVIAILLLLNITLYSFAEFDENADYFTPDFQFDDAITEFELENPDTPVPYDSASMSPAIRDLRRFEIILFGALPITMIFSQIIVDTGYYIKNDANPDYIPLLGTAVKTNDQQLYAVGVGVFMAFIVATADMIIYQKKIRLQEAEEKALKQKIFEKSQGFNEFEALEIKDIEDISGNNNE